MTQTKSPAPGVVPQRPGSMDYGSNNGAKIIPLPTSRNAHSPFDGLTASLVLAQYRAGTLPEGVFVALLSGCGLRP